MLAMTVFSQCESHMCAFLYIQIFKEKKQKKRKKREKRENEQSAETRSETMNEINYLDMLLIQIN